MPPLYYFNLVFGCFVVSNTWEVHALMSMPRNREVMVQMGENTDGIHTANVLEDSKHTIDSVGYVVFSFVLLELDT